MKLHRVHHQTAWLSAVCDVKKVVALNGQRRDGERLYFWSAEKGRGGAEGSNFFISIHPTRVLGWVPP